jgi:hypothetical protein
MSVKGSGRPSYEPDPHLKLSWSNLFDPNRSGAKGSQPRRPVVTLGARCWWLVLLVAIEWGWNALGLVHPSPALPAGIMCEEQEECLLFRIMYEEILKLHCVK